MAKAFIDDTHLTDIANAIRATLDESRQYLPSEMAAAIDSIPIIAQLNRKKYFQSVPTGAASGYANIEKVEGNTVKWNQLLKQGKLVDMGLPSGLLWATCNIDITQEDGFAASPFQYGCTMFSWGNIEGHNTPASGTTFDYNWGSVNAQEPYYEGQPYGSTPGSTLTADIVAGDTYDSARYNLGSLFMMPTSTQFQELFNNCDFVQADGTTVIDASVTDKRVTVNGIVGIYLKSKVNGNLMFFSASGYGNGASWNNRGAFGSYWSSSFLSSRDARNLRFYSGGVNPQISSGRYYGFAVRAVVNPNTIATGHNNYKYYVTKDINHDLTAIFGSGNEPTTVADFEAWREQNGLPSVANYNPGELISCKMEGLKSVGFNQWDELLESGSYNYNTGNKQEGSTTLRSVNKIKVFPSTTYYFKAARGAYRVCYYDYYGNFISSMSGYRGVNSTLDTPEGCGFITFGMNNVYGTTYNHDICINLSDPVKNGTYEPYKTDSVDIDVTTITGINTSTNVREVIFSSGMNKASDNDVDVIDLTTDTAERATFVLPNTYQELEYIESSGTQYINTGIYTSDNMSLKVTFAFIENVASTKRVFGKITGSTGSAINYREIGTNFYWFQAISNSGISSDLLKHTLEFSANGKLYRDGVEIGTKGTYSGVVNNPILLFAEISDGDAINYGKVQIYEWEVRNGDLVQKFIPARRIADSVLGMYDVVSGTFFTNAGTGNFIAGANVYKAHALDTPITYTDLQDANGNPLNPRYKIEQGGTEQVLPANTSTPTTVAPTLTTTYTKDNN